MSDLPAPTPLPLQPALDLQRSLILRWTALALALLLGLGLWEGWQLRRNALAELPASAQLAVTLLQEDIARRAGSFDRENLVLRPEVLDPLARRIPLCLAAYNLRGPLMAVHCEPVRPESALDRWLGERLRPAEDLRDERTLLMPAGIVVARVESQVPWEQVGHAWAERLRLLLAVAAGLGLMLLAVTRPVRRALEPTQQILAALARLEGGDHRVRLPLPALRELRHVAQSFNRLAEAWVALIEEQRRLALRLLDVREEERRRLARELHDEMAQRLSALQAEAAVSAALAERHADPALLGGAQRIASLTAQALDGLQQVLHELRPAALDRFGLGPALQALVDSPRRRPDGEPIACRLVLPDSGLDLGRLPAGHAVHVYRIVQEGLSNACRHGQATQVQVSLGLREDGGLRVVVQDDGRGPGPQGLAPGHGLLGLGERVQALDGRLQLSLPPGGGMQLAVDLPPLPAAGEGAR